MQYPLSDKATTILSEGYENMIMATETIKSQTAGKGGSISRRELIRLFHNLSNDRILEKRHEHLQTKTYRLIVFDGDAEIKALA